jgi:hypothetical protein
MKLIGNVHGIVALSIGEVSASTTFSKFKPAFLY